MHKNESPYISVIITAYNRKEYLLNAIKSAFNQTLSKDKYEILIIKNFKDVTIDDFINKNNINNILMDGTIGEFLYAGINASKGKIVSFLDDDDSFINNKLEIVYNNFKNNDNLCYYHNDYININDKYEKLNVNVNKDIVFNMSSISIKKDILNVDNLKKINNHPDDFMYLSALESNKEIIKGKEKLTHYMLHNSASNFGTNDFNEFKNYRIIQSEMAIKQFTIYKDIFTSKKSINYINIRITDAEIDNYLFCANKKPDNLMNIFKTNNRSFYNKIEIFLLYILVRLHNNFRNFVTKKLFDYNKKRI